MSVWSMFVYNKWTDSLVDTTVLIPHNNGVKDICNGYIRLV